MTKKKGKKRGGNKESYFDFDFCDRINLKFTLK